MARLVLAAVGAAVVALAVWAALPSRAPSLPPEVNAVTEVPPQRQPPPAPPAAAAPAPTANADATDAAIASCIGAQLQVEQAREQRGGPAPPGQPSDGAVVSRACAALYKQPACRSAMLRYDDAPPAERSRVVLEACARSYCPQLAAPKPSICNHVDNPPQDIQQFQEWAELRDAILVKEIGASAAQLVINPPRRPRPPAQPPLR